MLYFGTPFGKAVETTQNLLSRRILTSTFWQKFIDTFKVLAGYSFFTLREPDVAAGETLPFYFTLESPPQYGLFDAGLAAWSPLVISKFLMVLGGRFFQMGLGGGR